MSYYLVIISQLDSPIYETTLQSTKPNAAQQVQSGSTFPIWSSLSAASPGGGGSGVQSQTLNRSQSNSSSTPISSLSPSTTPQPGLGTSTPTPTSTGVSAQDLSTRAILGGAVGSVGGGGGGGGMTNKTERHVLQMIAHSSLDVVEEMMVGTGSLYLKCIDKFNEWNISAFIAPCAKFILLHDMRNDEGIRVFLTDVWECYTKILLNPFHKATTAIQSPGFDAKVKTSARRNL